MTSQLYYGNWLWRRLYWFWCRLCSILMACSLCLRGSLPLFARKCCWLSDVLVGDHTFMVFNWYSEWTDTDINYIGNRIVHGLFRLGKIDLFLHITHVFIHSNSVEVFRTIFKKTTGSTGVTHKHIHMSSRIKLYASHRLYHHIFGLRHFTVTKLLT